MKRQLGITRKLTLVFILFALSVLLGVGLLAYNSGRDSLRSATIAELLATAIEKEAGLTDWVDEKQADISQLTLDPSIISETANLMASSSDSEAHHLLQESLLAEFKSHVETGEFTSVFLLHPDTGEILLATDSSLEGTVFGDQQYFVNGKSGAYTQDLYNAPELPGPTMTAAAPVRTSDGELIAVLAGHLNLEEMNTIVNRRTGLRQTDDAFLINTSSQFVTQPRLMTDPAVLQRAVQTPAVNRCLEGSSGLIEAPDYRGVPSILVYRWMPEHRLCLIVKLEEAEAYAPTQAFGMAVAGISGVILLAAVILAAVIARGLTRPILSLRDGVIRFRHGELQADLPVSSSDELGVLAQEFNLMAAEIRQKDIQLRAHAQTLEQTVQERTKALRDTNTQLQRAEEIGHIGSWVWQVPENRLIPSEGLLKLLGVTEAEFGTTFEDYLKRIPPADAKQMRQAVQQALESPGTFDLESRVRRADGQVRTFYWRGESFVDSQGFPARIIAISVDITERKLAEESIRESEDKFKYIFDYSMVGNSITLPTGEIRVNRAFCEMLGYAEEELRKKRWQEITHPDDIELSAQEIASIYNGEKESVRFTKRYLHKDGSVVWADVSTVARRDQTGQPLYFMTAVLDITERKRAEELVQKVTDELRRSNAELEQFAYVASHDLQEPLRMVSSYVQLLAKRYKGKLDTDADEFIAFAVDGAKRMQNLINDLLAYSRVGTRGHEPTLVSMEQLFQEAVVDLQFAIEDSGATITHHNLPVVKGDPAQLGSVFQNLIANALKFHDAQPPVVHVTACQEGDHWLFSVRDNGIGIDPRFAERIFIIFQRLNERTAYAGTGIGLAICKRIILRHGGRIWVESQPGQGATFYFTLPVADLQS